MHEIIDSTPAPDWAFVVPKILAISIVLFATLAASVLAAIAVQALKGYFDFEIGKYLVWYVLPTTVGVVMFAVLAIFMQTLVPHKTFGWMLMLLFVVGADHARPPRLRAQPLPVRGQPRHAALRHERAGRLRALRLVVPRLLDRLRRCCSPCSPTRCGVAASARRSGPAWRSCRSAAGIAGGWRQRACWRWSYSAAGSSTTPTS